MTTERAFELSEYLPVSGSWSEYLGFVWDAFEVNYAGGTYQFSFLAYHMLMMSFVYSKIWQIRAIYPNKITAKAIKSATSPFGLSALPEKHALDLLKRVGCSKEELDVYKSFVNTRNNATHANGQMLFTEQDDIDMLIEKVLRAVEEIQSYSKSLIEDSYREFLIRSSDPENREYFDDSDQVSEALVRQNYLSIMDIELCASFDISSLSAYDGFDNMKTLHRALCEAYSFDAE